MQLTNWLREKYVYLLVFALFALVAIVLFLFQAGRMDVESAKVYVQALTSLATLALLYFAYFNVASKREEEIARLELAVRPIFIWEVESKDGHAFLSYKVQKHPIYDLRMLMKLDGELLKIEERHLDVEDANPAAARKTDITSFAAKALASGKPSLLEIEFAYHSEVGGRYEFRFTKEAAKKPKGFSFQHRKIVFAKYPWRKEAVRFED
ncbi:MAG: hypothetical protein QW568_03265 [Candidatus Anstonellaceae archaeon]